LIFIDKNQLGAGVGDIGAIAPRLGEVALWQKLVTRALGYRNVETPWHVEARGHLGGTNESHKTKAHLLSESVTIREIFIDQVIVIDAIEDDRIASNQLAIDREAALIR